MEELLRKLAEQNPQLPTDGGQVWDPADEDGDNAWYEDGDDA